jgi:hypothetical protein
MSPLRLTLLLVLLAVPAGASAADPLLPADTQSYVAVNVRQMLDAPLVKKTLLGPARQFLDNELSDISGVLKEVGIDPFRHLDRILIASPGGKDTDRGLIILHGTFDPAKIKAKVDALVRNNSENLKVHKVTLVKGTTAPVWEVIIAGQDQSMFVALVGNKTLIASPGKDYVVDALKTAHLKRKVVLKNRDFQALVEKLNPKQSISLAIQGKSLEGAGGVPFVPKVVADALGGVEAIGGGVTLANEVKLDVAVAGKTEKNARNARELLDRGVKLAMVGLALLDSENNKGLGLLLEVVKTVKVTGKGKVVGLSAKLTADVLQDFLGKE